MDMVYLGLFSMSFLAASLLPMSSEVLFATLFSAGYEPCILWFWATAGNTLGAALNWLLGAYFLHFESYRWFPFRRSKARQRAQAWFQRYGVWSLLFAWLPLVGDGLTFAAGLMRVRFTLFLLLTGMGKGARYAALVWLLAV